MDERGSHCPYLRPSETTAKGTGLASIAGKEDPLALDSSLAVSSDVQSVVYVGVACNGLEKPRSAQLFDSPGAHCRGRRRYTGPGASWGSGRRRPLLSFSPEGDGQGRGHSLMGSLTGAVQLRNDSAVVQRRAQRGRKPLVEHKGKSSLDSTHQNWGEQ